MLRAKGARVIVIFRNDDPSAMSDVEHERRIARIFSRYGVPQVLGVIPNCCEEGFREIRGVRNRPLESNQAMCAFLRDYAAESGSEIALHGFTHRTHRLSNPSRREFYEFRGVSLEEQTGWVQTGFAMIESTLRVRPTTFIPPWNRLDANTLIACERSGISIVSAGEWTHTRPGLLSLGVNCDPADFPRRLRVANESSNTVLIRVLFHSLTTRKVEELAQLETAVRLAATSPECEVLTLQQIGQRHSDLARKANAAAELAVDPTERHGTAAARAAVFRRAARRAFFIPNAAALTASQRCDRGEYDTAASLVAADDKLAKSQLLLARLACLALPFLLAALLCQTVRLPSSGMRWLVIAVGGTLSAVAGLRACRLATAIDTRRELRVATILTILGWIAAAAMFAT
ncbi:MAG: DUF2334 domain-containing protein [Planctomycetes bacterium]|nr:DUF2334 domain-containing protein [Planctomycetota bacterium]